MPAFGDEVRLVVAFDAGKRDMPEEPVGEEDEVGGDEAVAGKQRVGAVAVPSEFFKQGREGKQQPRREEGAGEAGLAGDAELLSAVTEGKRDELGEEEGDRANEHGGEQVARADGAQAEAGFEVGEQCRFLQEEPGSDGGRCDKVDDAEGALQGGIVCAMVTDWGAEATSSNTTPLPFNVEHDKRLARTALFVNVTARIL